MDEIVQEFLVESHENLDQLDRDFVALEQDPGSRELLSSIFRTIHTIKGTSGFLAFPRLERVTHVGENVLSRLRDGHLQLSPEVTDVLLAMVDAVRELLTTIEAGGEEGPVDVDGVVERLTACLEGRTPGGAPPLAPPTPSGPAPTAPPAPAPAPTPVRVPTLPPEPDAEPDAAPLRKPLGALLVESGITTREAVDDALRRQAAGDRRPLGQILTESGAADPAAVAEALARQTGRRSVADSSIRVDVELVDSLMRLVGELVLTRNQIVQQAGALDDPALTRATQRLSLIASELQEGVMKTRMQPIDHLWSKLPRLVRDLGAQLGKQVRLVMEGRETELDRTLLEAVKDPLTHIVRNSVDHGIELPDHRYGAGKDPVGELALRAYHEGGQVVVEVVDDGRGIDPAVVAAKGVERGLVTADELRGMSEREVLGLVFRPGFSTASSVTNVSGRGVGMDVVKTNLEKIGGTVELESVAGAGTTTRLRIPLTLAIIPALTITCGGARYAIPQASLLELVCLDAVRSRTAVEDVSGAAVYRLRGALLPLVWLSDVLDVPPGAGSRDETYIAVLQAEDRQFGLVVDRVLNTEEIVVKSLSARLKDIGLYQGATILGDGRVALILDVQALARRSRHHVEAAERVRSAAAAVRGPDECVERVLVAGLGQGRRVAIPLGMVTRLEELAADQLERVGDREVVQYRGRIVPVVRLATYLGSPGGGREGPTPVVVCTENGRSVALAIEEIVDVVEERVDVRSDVDAHGLIGSVVLRSRVTELLDVRRAILSADPHFYDLSVPCTSPEVTC